MTLNEYWAHCGTSWSDVVLAQTITCSSWTDWSKSRDATSNQACRLEASLQWLSCRSDVTLWCIERGKSLVFLDCWNRLHNDCVLFQWTPKCLATIVCAIPAWTIPKTWLRWFSLSHDMEKGQFLSKLKCFSRRIEFKQTFYTSQLNLYWPVNVVLMNTSKNDMCSLTMKSPCIWVGYYPILSKNITFIDCVHRTNMNNKYRKIILNFIMHSFFFPLVYHSIDQCFLKINETQY
jgi:hypothetical protein